MTIVFKISDNIKPKMIKYYEDLKRDKTPPYAIFQAEEGGTIITLYESGKVMFQGISADIDANIWIDMEKKFNGRIIDIKTGKDKTTTTKEVKTFNYDIYSTIGSDEVGTGDYFLPIVVTACFMDKANIKFLESLGVHDSKKLTDKKILSAAPVIMKKIPYESIILTNKEYNEWVNKGINMNEVKAIMHNKMLYKMKNKGFGYQKIIVDQFCLPGVYYNYLKEVPNKVTGITFITKAEDKNLSVACASIISRYLFLKEQEKLEKELGMSIPKGAGVKVDEVGKLIVKEKGKDILNNIAKISFKNTKRIIS